MSALSQRIGFMQGRLSPPVDGKIQAFPKTHWRDEFASGQSLGFARVEWTLDHEDLAANPLMIAEGQAEIRALSSSHGVAVSSITGDCFMQAPFWKEQGAARTALIAEMVGSDSLIWVSRRSSRYKSAPRTFAAAFKRRSPSR